MEAISRVQNDQTGARNSDWTRPNAVQFAATIFAREVTLGICGTGCLVPPLLY